MGQFFKFMFASMFGMIAAIFLSILIIIGIASNIEPAITFEASHYPIIGNAIAVCGGNNQGALVCGLEIPQQGLKRYDNANVNKNQDCDYFCGFHFALLVIPGIGIQLTG